MVCEVFAPAPPPKGSRPLNFDGADFAKQETNETEHRSLGGTGVYFAKAQCPPSLGDRQPKVSAAALSPPGDRQPRGERLPLPFWSRKFRASLAQAFIKGGP